MDIDQILATVKGVWSASDVSELRAALTHPLARKQVMEIAKREFASVRVGQPAPDFDLRVLDGEGSVRLSSHFGRRPVALVFGSYT